MSREMNEEGRCKQCGQRMMTLEEFMVEVHPTIGRFAQNYIEFIMNMEMKGEQTDSKIKVHEGSRWEEFIMFLIGEQLMSIPDLLDAVSRAAKFAVENGLMSVVGVEDKPETKH